MRGCAFFFLSPRRRSGERTEERGCFYPARKAPPLPVPLLQSDGGEGVVAADPRPPNHVTSCAATSRRGRRSAPPLQSDGTGRDSPGPKPCPQDQSQGGVSGN